MRYTELLQDPILFLPVSCGSATFNTGLLKRLQSYLTALHTIDDGPVGIEDLPYVTGAFIKSTHTAFIDALLNVIAFYHDGKPASAYHRLDEALKNELKDFSQILKISTYEVGETFFRMRVKSGNHLFTPDEMFHIPFQLRGIVSTQRFSIPGFPCLYLGRTLYGCWEELNRPNINEFQAVRLESLRPITYLDLTPPINMDHLLSRDIYHYLMTWPLIACCSVKVRDYSQPFKSEYIIPQLLLQWVRENNALDGIRFNSTHIPFHESGSVGDFSNLVMPVKTSADDGYCYDLQSRFASTEAISWQLYQHSTGGQTFLRSRADNMKVNSRIQQLELIKGQTNPYSSSVFGDLERYLDQLPVVSLHDRG